MKESLPSFSSWFDRRKVERSSRGRVFLGGGGLTTHTRFMPTHDGSESGSRQHRARDWRHVRTTSHHSPCAESQDAWQWCGDQAFLDHMPDQVQQSSRGRSALDRRRRESSAARPAARPEALVEPCSTRLRPKGAAEPHPTISLGRPDHPTVGSNQVFGLCPGPNCYDLRSMVLGSPAEKWGEIAPWLGACAGCWHGDARDRSTLGNTFQGKRLKVKIEARRLCPTI